MDFKLLTREPALLLDFVETGLVMLVALGIALTGDQQAYIVAVLVAIIGLIKGWATRPFTVSVITDLGRAVLVLVASFAPGINLSANMIAVIVTFLGTATTLVARAQVTPVYDPKPLEVAHG